MKNNLEEVMTEPTKEQIEKWEAEVKPLAEDHAMEPDMSSSFRKSFKLGYLAAKKSDFKEIESLKAQLANMVKIQINRNKFLEKQDKENGSSNESN